jgi:hypothetical protein
VQLVPQLAVEVLLRQLELHRWYPPVQAKLQEPPLVQLGVEFGGFERVQSVQFAPQELTETTWQVPSGQRRVPGEQEPPPMLR